MTQPLKRTIPPRQSLEDEKLWTERVILAQSPFWIIAVALVISTGVPRHWNDIEYLLFSTTVAAPSVVLPALLSSRRDLNHRPWSHRYWLKLNVWVAVVVCFGTYFGSHYFFDAVGLRYIFNVDWNFSWVIVGKSRQEVPVFMYPLTHAYFMTYFTSMMAVERKIVRRLQLGWIGRQALVPVLSYGLAFAEIFVMAKNHGLAEVQVFGNGSPGSADRDIYNARALINRDKLNGYTPTAALIKLFDEMDVPYVVKWADDEPSRLVGLVWTFSYCLQIWKRFPEIISFDNTYNTNRFKLPLFQATG
ncbi:Cycloeucalenol cycloisomerase [Fusarium keratoplasticum]|uniref:Cycloeucalenol cycloisomerase n=1 Tax=Fusarium keratoplasticum TaxID=1328300 RepID=A0ACC0QEG6_9HYPO|nr:Cycloeucalenol cycloisomerase [Fusarium keratoplasticum]KAI8648711.1 Cycloeucalenol cycloisomerase [Fusarium keratoplasticum]